MIVSGFCKVVFKETADGICGGSAKNLLSVSLEGAVG